ncbi:MAG: tripartite tricarboxylate transporter substrate-binding protein [Chloroflexi bacterium]|nr:tripartite tricarboxylate transporter substrate-binding protein [Chloroflexota bacterium]
MDGRLTRWLAGVAVVALGLGLVVGCAKQTSSASPEEFYRGKTFNWVVSSGAQGGDETDLLARVIAPYLAKELGGSVKVSNAASEDGLNQVYNEEKKDGLTMVHKSTAAVISNDILKAPGVQYATEKFNWIADVFPAGKVMQVSPKMTYKTLDELRKAKGLKGGGTTAKGALAVSAAVMMDVLGLDGKVVTGFKGKKDLVLAVTRGEVDFLVSSDTSAQKDEDDELLKNFLVVTKEKSRVVPNLPTMYDMGVKVPQEKVAMVEYILAAGSAVALPPDVPADRVEYLRKVFLKVSDNKDMQAEIKKIMGATAAFMPGKDLQDKMAAIKSNTELAKQLDATLSKYTAVQ